MLIVFNLPGSRILADNIKYNEKKLYKTQEVILFVIQVIRKTINNLKMERLTKALINFLFLVVGTRYVMYISVL